MNRLFSSTFAGAVGCALALQFPATAIAKSNERVLHSFGSGTDGVEPNASLIDVNGTLYGTTWHGGTNSNSAFCDGGGLYGCGTVFSIDPKTGDETVLHSFCSQKKCADGVLPKAGLVDVKGTLYGTTGIGGAYHGGTLFSLDPATGEMTVLHSFGKGKDGVEPDATLIDVKGTLYGTTSGGGAFEGGTVFALTP